MILGVIALLIVSVLGIVLILRVDKHNTLMEKQVTLTIESVSILRNSYRLNSEHLDCESHYDRRMRFLQDTQIRKNQIDNLATYQRIANLNLLLLENTYKEKLEEQAYQVTLKANRERITKEMTQEQIKNI